jgi:hypothetical protein
MGLLASQEELCFTELLNRFSFKEGMVIRNGHKNSSLANSCSVIFLICKLVVTCSNLTREVGWLIHMVLVVILNPCRKLSGHYLEMWSGHLLTCPNRRHITQTMKLMRHRNSLPSHQKSGDTPIIGHQNKSETFYYLKQIQIISECLCPCFPRANIGHEYCLYTATCQRLEENSVIIQRVHIH